jgi:hypothetical protein
MEWLYGIAWWTGLSLPPFVLAYRFLPRGRRCPACEEETVLLRSALPRPVRGRLARRWCMHCGWVGLTRPRQSADPYVAPRDSRSSARDDTRAPWHEGPEAESEGTGP